MAKTVSLAKHHGLVERVKMLSERLTALEREMGHLQAMLYPPQDAGTLIVSEPGETLVLP